MPQIFPSGWEALVETGSAQRELETLSHLAAGLPDDYVVYHGVHWTNVRQGYSAYGEIDFIILAPDGRLLTIEQKSGFLEETPEGLIKHYAGKAKNVPLQMMRAIAGLRKRFDRRGDPLVVDYLLYCPDYVVKSPTIAGIDLERIVDARRREQLCEVVCEILGTSDPTPQQARVKAFLDETLELVPDPSTMIGQAQALVSRLSEGMASWVRQLEFSPFRLRVIGTAGSGKTQLAISEYRAALSAGLRPLYVCFNRPLADHLLRLVPQGGRVMTFHMLCDAWARHQGKMLDYGANAVWKEMEQALAEADIPAMWQCDVLIVDEGQDFTDTWARTLLRFLAPGGRAFWLEDPMQNLYDRSAVDLPDWTILRAQTNYRSPRQVVDWLASLCEQPSLRASSPFAAADIETFSYTDGDVQALFAQTKAAISHCLDAGFAIKDLALLSLHGRNHSRILNLDVLGRHQLRSFTGTYDSEGEPIYREGELLAETVYRFKGQSAPAVILTEIDFIELDELALRKLFVGMTRARLKLVLVLSQQAEAALVARL